MAGVVDRVVRAGTDVAVLATSREGLGVSGERIVAVGSLGVPDQDASGDVARALRMRCSCSSHEPLTHAQISC